MDDAIRIESRPVLLLANRQWAPDMKLVGGRDFVSISKWNRGFVRFMTGKALDLRKDKEGQSGSVDSPVIDKILEQRQNSANELLLEALNMDGSGDEDPNPPKKKKRKAQRATAKDAIHVPPIMDVNIDGHKMAILYEGLGMFNFWMELTEVNLNWLNDKLKDANVKSRKAKQKARPAGVQAADASDIEADGDGQEE